MLNRGWFAARMTPLTLRSPPIRSGVHVRSRIPRRLPRSVRAIYHYWDDKRNGRLMPRRADLDPVDIPKLLPDIGLVDVVPDERQYVYRLIGTNEARCAAATRPARRSATPISGPASTRCSSTMTPSCAPARRSRPRPQPDQRRPLHPPRNDLSAAVGRRRDREHGAVPDRLRAAAAAGLGRVISAAPAHEARQFRRAGQIFHTEGNPPAGPVFVASDNRSVR